MSEFSICLIILHIWQVFEDALGSVLCQGFEYGMVVYAVVKQSSEYVCIWLKMPEYA